LTLRLFTEADVDPMHAILARPGVLRYFPRTEPPPRERVERSIQGFLRHWTEHGFGLWALEMKGEGRLIGRAGLQRIPETGEVEVDFILDAPYWGRGLATEAGRASLDHGFGPLGLDEIVGIVHPENAASRAVLEKIGMSFTRNAEYFGMACCRYAARVSRPAS